MISPAVSPGSFLEEIKHISRTVAAAHADSVDRDARFPSEALDALREIGALSAWVPAIHGGAGHTLTEIADACRELARGCSATAMVFAMHQLQVANLVRHSDPRSALGDYLRRLCDEQRLIASITSEVGTGGDMGKSVAALTPSGQGGWHFEKQAPTISYGGHCDDLLTTLRRSPEADSSDQVMVLHARRETQMEPTGSWDTLGMRGTCSPGFIVRAEVSDDQVLGEPFGSMLAETIVPISHILWANVWVGIATEAFERGRTFARDSARRTPGTTPSSARRLSEIYPQLRLLRSEVATAQRDFEAWDDSEDRARLGVLGAGLRFNGLKLAVSEGAPAICSGVLAAVGIMAYKNDSPYAVGRLLRDSLSGQLMVANERVHAVNAGLLMIAKDL